MCMKNAILFKYAGRRFDGPALSPAAVVGAVIYSLTGLMTPAARRYHNARRAAWHDHAAGLQSELNAERARGWGWRYIDGRRVDF